VYAPKWFFRPGRFVGERHNQVNIFRVLELKTPREIDAVRVTGTFVAELLGDLAARAEVG
jgi:hypothetical protein